jgi:hypothetical protein
MEDAKVTLEISTDSEGKKISIAIQVLLLLLIM